MTISPTGATPVLALPYLNEADPPDIATATQQMMLAVEALYHARIGVVEAYAGSTAPTNSVFCDGSALTRAGTYSNLFAIISTVWGAGNGTTTFNIPDLRGRFPSGVQSNAVLGVGGAQPYQLLGSSGGGVFAYSDSGPGSVPVPASGTYSIGVRNPYATFNFIIWYA